MIYFTVLQFNLMLLKEANETVSLYVVRLTVLAYLLVVVVLVPWGIYYLFSSYETQLQYSEYDLVINEIVDGSTKYIRANYESLNIISTVFSNQCPTIADWPNCTIPIISFADISKSVMLIANMKTVFLSIILKENQVSSFESFAYDFFQSEGYPSIGTSAIGRGIYAKNGTQWIHSTIADPIAPHPYIMPVLFAGYLNISRAIMFNMYYDPRRIVAIDDLIDCFNVSYNDSCYSITESLPISELGVIKPGVWTFGTVSPTLNSTFLTGLTMTSISWQTLFESIYTSSMDELIVVVESNSGCNSYEIKEGAVLYLGGYRERPNRRLRKYERSFILYKSKYSSVTNTVFIYPTTKYGRSGMGNVPVIACIVAVVVLVVSAGVVFCYDYVVNRMTREREIISNTKRLFVRYISHEIRTPLNTVHLGLLVLKGEIFNTVSSLQLEPELSSYVKSWLGLIDEVEDSSDIAVTVLNDLITYDKLMTNNLQLELKSVALYGKVIDSLKPFKIQAREKNIRITHALSVKENEVESEKLFCDDLNVGLNNHPVSQLIAIVDEIKIGQAMNNLISNALKFTPRDGVVTLSG